MVYVIKSPVRGVDPRSEAGTIGSIARCAFATLVLLVAASALASVAFAAPQPLTRTQYATDLQRSVDPPVQNLYDTFYIFTGGHTTLRWATSRTLRARVETRMAISELSALVAPAKVRRQHIQILAALRQLDSDLRVPIDRAAKGRQAVLNWWLQTYGSLPEILQLNRLHESLSHAGYWGNP